MKQDTLPPLNLTIAGALFDFMGFLTSHETQWKFSSCDDANPAVDAIEQWAKAKGHSIADVDVMGWQAAIAAQAQPAPAAQEPDACPTCGSSCNERDELDKAERAIGRLMAAQEPLPDSLYPHSKDWIAGGYAQRVAWLHEMYESSKATFEAYLAQQEQAGWVSVPVNASPEMVEAAEQVEDLYRRGTPETWGKVYRAMLAAAPKQEQGEIK